MRVLCNEYVDLFLYKWWYLNGFGPIRDRHTETIQIRPLKPDINEENIDTQFIKVRILGPYNKKDNISKIGVEN